MTDELVGNYDVIILANWVQEINPQFLKDKLEKMFNDNLNRGGTIIIDSCSSIPAKFYKYTHDIKWLTGNINASVQEICENLRSRIGQERSIIGIRNIYAVKKQL